jgi:hypothetical protein
VSFLSDVLGAQGKAAFVFATREPDAQLVHKWFDLAKPADLRGALEQALDINDAGADVYFTTSRYAGKITRGYVEKGATGKLSRGRGRKRANVADIKSFWVDIDCGPAKWGKANADKRESLYPTQRKALAAVAEALDAIKTLADPTYIINSGAGIHLYWCLDEAVDVDVWSSIATRLRDTLLAAGLKLDRPRSCDAASIMRLPGSIHWGETERRGKETTGAVLGAGRIGDIYDAEEFVKGLVASKVKPKQQARPDGPRASSAATDIAGFAVAAGALSASLARASEANKLPPPPETDYNVQLVLEMLAARGSDLPYEEWRDVIWAVKDTGWEIAYEMLEQWCELSTAPWSKPWQSELRKVWESDSGGTGKRITCASLISWARKEAGDTSLRFLDARESKIESDGGQLITVDHPGRKSATYVMPKLPNNYMRKPDEPGIWLRTAQVEAGQQVDEDDDNTVWEWSKLTDIDFYITDRVRTDTGEHTFTCVKVEPHGGMEVFELPTSIVSAPSKVAEALNARSIFANGEKGAYNMTRYLVEQGKALLQAKAATREYSSLGWHGVDEDRGFALGNAMYDINGNKKVLQYSKRVAKLAKSTEPRGTLDKWKTLPALYEGKDYAAAQAVILMSMGAPLHAFTGERGGLVNLFTEGSGYGKTAVLQTALSVWSGVADLTHHETLMMGDKTDMAAEFKLTQANSLPVGLDELTSSIHGDKTGRLQQALLRFVYGTTQGRGKARMKSSGEEMRESGSWDTFLISTANAAMESLFASDTARSADGERARVLDINGESMPRVDDFAAEGISIKELARRRDILTRVMPNNYGVAGEALLESYLSDFHATADHVLDTFTKYQHQYGNRDRFIVAKMTIARVAWEHATELGLVSYDWEPIEELLRDAIIQQHEAQRESKAADPEALLNEYVRLHADGIAVVTHDRSGTPRQVGSSMPRKALVGRWEVDRNHLYLLRAELTKFCADNRVDHKSLFDYLQRRRAILVPNKKVSLGRGLSIPGQYNAILLDATAAGIIEPPTEEQDSD